MDSSVSPKEEIWFLHVCHHISNAVYLLVLKVTVQLLQISYFVFASSSSCFNNVRTVHSQESTDFNSKLFKLRHECKKHSIIFCVKYSSLKGYSVSANHRALETNSYGQQRDRMAMENSS
jgi:hypothetical protein